MSQKLKRYKGLTYGNDFSKRKKHNGKIPLSKETDSKIFSQSIHLKHITLVKYFRIICLNLFC